MPVRTSLCLMASMVREKKISPVELVDEHLRQIEKVNPSLNAFVEIFADEARTQARAAEQSLMRGEIPGPLQGVPVTVKDSFDIAGHATLCGSRFRRDHRAAHDAAAVARLKHAGAIILGKTNCPEFLSNYETDNAITGRTNNPWNPDRTAGGSSGGESAAISSFCSAGGIGSDGGGSVRIPAHFCGIAALKPTPGRVSAAGHFPQIAHPGGLLGVAGPMARAARDLRLLFDVLAGYDSDDPFSVPFPLRSLPAKKVRIGVWPQFYDVPVDPEILAVVDRAAQQLASIGMRVDSFEPRGMERAPNVWWFFFGQLAAPFMRDLIRGREEDAHWTGTEFMRRALELPEPSGVDVVTQLGIRDRLRSSMLRQMEETPVLLMPPCGVTAFPHRSRRWKVGGREIGLFQAMMPVTPFNLFGMPAVVIPYGMSSEGLPIGIQLVGRPFEEELLLDLAIQLEEARGPFAGPPAMGIEP